MSFEIIFVTEDSGSSPATEIQFKGQRLCIIRFSLAGVPNIEFVQDLYVGLDVKMEFPLAEFHEAVQFAAAELVAWVKAISDGETEA